MSKIINLISGRSDMSNEVVSQSSEYRYFRSTISQKKIVVDQSNTSTAWTLYDTGPRDNDCPILFLPPVSGTADTFFRQLLHLKGKGYRAISLEYPTYWTLEEFNQGFMRLLDHLGVRKVHVFGASLGGFLLQKFAEITNRRDPRIHSIILCNSFADTTIFHHTDSAMLFWMMPSVLLKNIIMGNKSIDLIAKDKTIRSSIDFMNERLDSLSQQELASRLTLNCISSYVQPQKLQNIPITILDVFDHCAISERVKQELYKMYPLAKRAHLKSGGNYPYISRSEEVNMHIVIHLRQFENTQFSAKPKLHP
ncbi:maspardin-like [Brevipalpus obovatus]|uniref:maspardin-like n=1 Tax=Brevipalpus obovatus TaxID=246614 RepID=UPI003D9E3B05